MKHDTVTILLAFLGLVAAHPAGRVGYRPPRMLRGREVPQEHSHEQFLTIVRASLATNNPANIEDPVFGLLGNAAAAAGQGSITNTDCLQQATADQAFTNAKVAGDVAGMTAALIYRALERNTGSVGLASVPCTAIAATNPEIAALSQHQDPASVGAAATNKAITLVLAMQIASVGGDPQDALKAGTFAPGTIGDPTAKGNSCDTTDDLVGCIFTQNLLVEDASPAEIFAAAGGMSGGMAMVTTAASSTSSIPAAVTSAPLANTCACAGASPTMTTVAPLSDANSATASATMCSATVASSAAAVSTDTASGTNVQTFTGALGGISAPPVIFTEGSDRPFSTDDSTFVNSGAALQRSCSVQHNQCANAANSGTLAGGESQCETQETACNAAISSTKVRRATLDFGSCTDPAIVFGQQADRPDANAFIAANQADFNHGSALNIGVIASFICQRLGSPCDAAADAIAACAAGETAASGLTGQQAADAFNAALGLSGGGSVASSTAAAVASAATCACT